VGQPEFFSALDGFLEQTPVPVLQDYLRFRLVSSYAEYLRKAFDDEHFRFYNQVLSGLRGIRGEARPAMWRAEPDRVRIW
jgi:putative endopeptidase